MTTIEMLKKISENNWKNPKGNDWKNAGIERDSNFCEQLDKFWVNFMRAQVFCADNLDASECYCDAAEECLTAAFNALDIHPNTAMVLRMCSLCIIKNVKDKVRHTSKTTFRKNALKYLFDCVNGHSNFVEDEKLHKAITPKAKKDSFGWTSVKFDPEQVAAFLAAMTPDQKKALLDAAKAA